MNQESKLINNAVVVVILTRATPLQSTDIAFKEYITKKTTTGNRDQQSTQAPLCKVITGVREYTIVSYQPKDLHPKAKKGMVARTGTEMELKTDLRLVKLLVEQLTNFQSIQFEESK